MKQRRVFRLLSLFSGAGGLDFAFESSGLFSVRVAIESEPVFCETLRMNRGRHRFRNLEVIQADIDTLCPDEISRQYFANDAPDGIVGCPPCQSFSTMGKERGIADARGRLVFSFVRWATELPVRFFVMENVPQLATIQGGQVLDVVKDSFRRAGFSVECKVLNCADYGAATHRKRLVVVGFRDAEAFQFPEPTHAPLDAGLTFGLPRYRSVREAFSGLPKPTSRPPGTIPDHWAVNHTEDVVNQFRKVPPGTYYRHRRRSRLAFDQTCPSLLAGDLRGIRSHIHPGENRELTNRESARIQGFPDDYLFSGNHAAVGLQIANAVPIELGRSIARAVGRELVKKNGIGVAAPSAVRRLLGVRRERGSIDADEALATASAWIQRLRTPLEHKVSGVWELKAVYADACRVYYTAAAVSRRRELEPALRDQFLGKLFSLRSHLDSAVVSGLHSLPDQQEVLSQAVTGFFGFSAKQGVSIRYPLSTCVPTARCGGRCYAHDGRDRELHLVFRSALNYTIGSRYESGDRSERKSILAMLARPVERAVEAAIEASRQAESDGFRRQPRIRFSHIGEMASTPNFTNALGRMIKSREPKVQCVIYTRHPNATRLDMNVFVINFTVEGEQDPRLKLVPVGARLVNSSWDGLLMTSAAVNFLEHHVEKVCRPIGEGRICPVTIDHGVNRSCDGARCDLCFVPN